MTPFIRCLFLGCGFLLVVSACTDHSLPSPDGDLSLDGASSGDLVLETQGEDTSPEDAAQTVETCFEDIGGALMVDYEQFHPTVGSHCKGTNHQEIDGIERLVFLGDSVTTGTPPTLTKEFYTALLTDMLEERFGALEVQNCAAFGARTDDLLIGKEEIADCFPLDIDPRRTLVVMTIGGNDILKWAEALLSLEEALIEADKAALLLDDAIAWLTDPQRFPGGSFVVYANPFEYTDATGDLGACAIAQSLGLEGNWLEGADAFLHFQEQFMEIAVKHQVDMVFSLEQFCGHGFHHDNPESQCYRGPDAERWFDFTCIHPNPTGHAVLADLFVSVIDE